MKRYIFILLLLGLNLMAQSKGTDLKYADSLFKHGRQNEASLIYEKYIAQAPNKDLVPLPIYYKVAYMSEKRNDYAKALYYLSLIYNRQPKQVVMNKINEIASANALQGFEVDDFSFVFLFFRNYSIYLTLFLLSAGIYTCVVLWQKYRQNEPIRNRHKWVLVAYLMALLLLLNLPSSYQIAIVNKSPVYMREMPSSAAPVKWTITKGNKLVIIGEEDEWWQIWWEQKTLYVRKLDVWKIG
ncbi:MAG: hypothetical protein MUE30_02915 [Spirosomaceae bacterium]|jgi:hypothetical protein|nr:hypothetical protein [Spirosomataceae bacterium]